MRQISVSTQATWHYPALNDSPYDEGADWIAGGAEISAFIEYWRFYQSGQFIHHLALREDHMARLNLFAPNFFVPAEGKKYLNVSLGVCMIADIVELAVRLALKGILIPSATISIQLYDMAGRELTYMVPGRRLPDSYWFKTQRVNLEHQYGTDEIIGRSPDIAVDLSSELLRQAGWDAPRPLIVDDQSRRLARMHDRHLGG